MALDKVVGSAAEAVADIGDGATLAVGGFGLCGVPSVLIAALLEQGVTGLSSGVQQLRRRRLGPRACCCGQPHRPDDVVVRRREQGVRAAVPPGELEVELMPQGTLAERLRAGGAGIPAFYTPPASAPRSPTAGCRWRYAADGSVALAVAAEGDPRVRRPRRTCWSEASSPTSRSCTPEAATGTATSSSTSSARNFNPLVRDGRADHHRRGRGARRARRARSRRGPHAGHLRAARRRATADQAADKRIERRTDAREEA